MDKEQLYIDGVNLLESYLKKYLKDKEIEKKDEYSMMAPEIEKNPNGEFKLVFSVKKNAKPPYILNEKMIFDLEKFFFEGYKEIDSESSVNNNVELMKEKIVKLAELFYISNSLKRHDDASEEYQKNKKMLYEKTNEYINEFQKKKQEADELFVITSKYGIDFVHEKTIDITKVYSKENIVEDDIKNVIEESELKATTTDNLELQKSTNEEQLEEDYDKIIERLNNGNSENKRYTFDWKENEDLRYASDESLELAYRLIEKGRISLVPKINEKENKVSITTQVVSLCDTSEFNMPTSDFLNKLLEEEDKIFTSKSFTWDYGINSKWTLNGCLDCKFQECPKVLAAYVLYLKNNGLLKEKLEDRKNFRAEKEINSYFEFNWENKDGLKKVPDNIYNYCKELVERKVVAVNKKLYKGEVRIESKISCDEYRLMNFDVSQIPQDRKWKVSKFLSRKTNDEVTVFCGPYSCRLDLCPYMVAGYIDYLKKSGKEDKIIVDRKYYAENKAAIDVEISENKRKKLENLSERKEKKLDEFIEYKDKIKNINSLLEEITDRYQNNLHCIICGNDEKTKSDFINKLEILLKDEGKAKIIRRMSMQNFASIYTHFEDTYFPLKEDQAKTDKKGVRYRGRALVKYADFEEDALYILDGISEFIYDYNVATSKIDVYETQEIRRKQMLYMIDILTKMTGNNYIIINATKEEVENFLALDAGLKFVYQNNVFEIPDLTIDEMFDLYLKALKPEILEEVRNDIANYKNLFNEYVSLNKTFMPFDDRELVNYLVNYASSKGKAVFPENIYKKETVEESLKNIIGLQSVKEKLKEFEKYMLFQLKAKANNLDLKSSNVHMIFTGNPGTGKTTIARIMAKMLFDLGVIKENKLIEVERKDLVGEYIGKTAPKTAEVIEKAMGRSFVYR